jgi:hypothetical protein
MARWAPLNERQFSVLQRVADPKDSVTSRESRLANTVYALRARKLVDTIRVRGVGWQARITEAGRHYLVHGAYQQPAAKASSSRTRRPVPATPPSKRAVAGKDRLVIAGEELLRRLHDAACMLRIADPNDEERAAWRRAIHAAKQRGLIPAGTHLRHSGRDRDDLVIELVDGAHPGARYWKGERPQVEVPRTLETPHPVVAEPQRRTDLIAVSPESRSRALSLVQALVEEALRREHVVHLDESGAPGFCVVIGRWPYRLVMSEEWTTVDQLPTIKELDATGAYEWQRIRPERQTVPSGRLTLELPDDWRYRGRPRRWGDRQRWRLDDKLRDILAEIEARAALAEERQVAKEQAAAERHRQWEQAVAQARQQLIIDRGAEALRAQVEGWEQAHRIRTFCEALVRAAPGNAELTADARSWLQWVQAYADSLDPFTPGVPVAPEDRKITPEDLRPYLGRWSPYGPDRG